MVRAFILCLLAVSLSAQSRPLTAPSLIIDVRQESTDKTTTTWKTDWGSIGTDSLHARTLLVKLKTVGDFERDVMLEWYFVGQFNRPTGGLTLYGAGAARTKTEPAASAKPYVIGPSWVEHSRDRYAALGFTESDGVKPFGWVILVWQHNHLVKATASTPELAEKFSEELKPLGEPKLTKSG